MENQVILLLITDDPKQHYPVVLKLLALLEGVIFKSNRNFYSLNCLYPFRTGKKEKFQTEICQNRNYCQVHISDDETNILISSRRQVFKTPVCDLCAFSDHIRKK